MLWLGKRPGSSQADYKPSATQTPTDPLEHWQGYHKVNDTEDHQQYQKMNKGLLCLPKAGEQTGIC